MRSNDTAFKSPGSVLAGEKIEKTGRVRAKLCLCMLLTGFAMVGLKLVHIQVFQHRFWARYADEQRESAIVVRPRRGTVYDRKMTPLATSVVQEVLCVAPQSIDNPPQLARALSPYAGMSAEKIVEKIENTSLKLLYLRRGLDVETTRKISSMELEGVEFRSESSRRYPKGSLASNLIGFANLDDKGMEGIEYKYDSQLAGESGKMLLIKDNSRRQIASLTQTIKEARDGNHIVLTIDEVIQYITEKALDGIIGSFSPESASAVVLDPKTGEVLALACRPTFDPNTPSTYKAERLRNRVIIDTFEPGSAFKPIAAAAALERGVITPGDRVYCELGAMRYHGHTYNDVHPLAEISFADVIAQSSNIGMIKVVSLMQPQSLYHYIRSFGFGQLTGVALPGESTGIVRPPSRWSGLSMGSIPIGQEVSVTCIQLAAAFSAIANDGMLMRPHVVSAVMTPEGEMLKGYRPQPLRRVIERHTAESLTEMMKLAVNSGTGTAARLTEYSCAGKTGTAQKPDLEAGGYYRNKYVAIFAGFVPADEPVACIVVVADSPNKRHYGGDVSAPAFKEIAQGILNYLEVPPDRPRERAPGAQRMVVTARNAANERGKNDPATPSADGVPRMPDVRGMTMKAVLESLSIYSLRFEFEGSGVAFRQHPRPGEEIVNGRIVQVSFGQRHPS